MRIERDRFVWYVCANGNRCRVSKRVALELLEAGCCEVGEDIEGERLRHVWTLLGEGYIHLSKRVLTRIGPAPKHVEGELAKGLTVLRSHICLNSPVGYCAYNEEEDPRCDFCVFCGHPHERK